MRRAIDSTGNGIALPSNRLRKTVVQVLVSTITKKWTRLDCIRRLDQQHKSIPKFIPKIASCTRISILVLVACLWIVFLADRCEKRCSQINIHVHSTISNKHGKSIIHQKWHLLYHPTFFCNFCVVLLVPRRECH